MQATEVCFLFVVSTIVLFIAFKTLKYFKNNSGLTKNCRNKLKGTLYEEEIEKKGRNARKRVRHIPAGGSPQKMQTNRRASLFSNMNIPTPESVNYHFTRQCNYKCGFCFHTAKTSFVLPIEDAKRGLRLLKEAGMKKINFSGGEPFIHERGRYVGELTKFCKKDLQMPSVSIVSNGSLIKEKWFQDYGEFLDILAISCDSFNEKTNERIGRYKKGTSHIECLKRVREWCKQYRVAFKINTVVNSYNLEENMVEQINFLAPVRWKVFQCLLIAGENCGEDAIRNAESFVISNDDFQRFIERHSELPCLVEESNKKMRFLDCSSGGKKPTRSILDVGVENAIQSSGFDEQMFFKRGGKYVWSKEDMKLDW